MPSTISMAWLKAGSRCSPIRRCTSASARLRAHGSVTSSARIGWYRCTRPAISGSAPAWPRTDREAGMLYTRLLGPSWPQLADPVRVIHGSGPTVRARGRLRITNGSSQLARLVARVLCLPRACDASETRLVITSGADGETWRRCFGDRRLDTRQYQAGASELAERIGILEFRFRLEVMDGSLLFRQLEAALLCGSVRLRLPASCVPRIAAREDAAGERRISVRVSVVFPMVGPILGYEGTV